MSTSTETQTKAQQREDAIAQLRELFPVGSTARTILRHVSRSGMSRSISVVAPNGDDVTWLVARATGNKLDNRHDGIRMSGCGMDMGFALVYSMSRALYPDGHKCTGRSERGVSRRGVHRCPSNDHSNDGQQAARDWRAAHPHEHELQGYYAAMRAYIEHRLSTDLGYRRSRQHGDGGYAVSQRWL